MPPDPLLANPYHANIVLNLPEDMDTRKHQSRQHAIHLAKKSEWLAKDPDYKIV